MSWQSFVDALSEESKVKYLRWSDKFAKHLEESQNIQDLGISVSSFFEKLHSNGYATSTLWSIHSIIKTYLQAQHNFNTEEKLPLLTRMFEGWQKKESTKKSAVFTREQVDTFIQSAPDDHEYLVKKVALIIGLHGVMRKAELVNLNFSNVQIVDNMNNSIRGSFQRKKSKGPQANSTFLITEDLPKKKVLMYIDIFKSSVSFVL